MRVSETLPVKEMCKGTREIFDYAICAGCGSVYIKDFPENIAKYYEHYYSFGDDSLTLDQLWWKRTMVSIYARCVVRGGFSFLFRSFFRCPSPREMTVLTPNLQAFLFLGPKADARILDVGSGGGQFVNMLHRFGYRCVTGIDPFLEESGARPDLRRADILLVSGIYDLILFNHSLEHMTNPEAAVQKCAALLAPGGTVVIHLPNMDSREFARYKQNWCWLHAPYHFAIPSYEGVKSMAAGCGFKVADVICTSRYDHYLYHDEYSRGISDRDANSVRRELEAGTFSQQRWTELSQSAYSLNKALTGDWIAYYLKRN